MVMHRSQRHQDEAPDVLDSDEGSSVEDKNSEEKDSDAEAVQSALHILPSDATIPELRKALALCQKSLTETRAKLRITTKELQTLNAALPPKKRKGIMNKTDPLNEDIGRVAKKFAMLYRLWVIDGLFPVKSNLNPDVDLLSAGRWDSPEAKREAILTELFGIMPQHVHKEVVKYKPFGSVFTSFLNQERSNMLRAVKEASALIFAPLKVPDATIFVSVARKRDDPEMKQLSMKDGTYHRVAPILFANPNQVTAEGFLRNPVLVNILRLLIFGKNALTKEKARGGPKTRGHIHGIRSVTEGLIALAAIFARYLLTPDPELQSVGSETKIPYEADYDFYLQRLFKRSGWAINTVDFFNMQIFGSKNQQALSTQQVAPPAPARTWEDDFLDDLDNAEPGAPMSTSTSGALDASDSAFRQPGPGFPLSSARRLPALSPAPSSLSASPSPPSSPSHADPPQVTASSSMVSIHNHPGASLSSISRLQVDVGQMNINCDPTSRQEPVNAQPASVSGSRRVSSARRVPVPVHTPESYVPASSEPLIQKRTTRARAKPKK